jgi:hypothetical protein
MGLFSKQTDAEKVEKQIKKDKLLLFLGESLQPIGKIAKGKVVGLSLVPDSKVINIRHDKIDITLPYDRIKSFKLENETTLAKSGSTIARALVGSALFGGVGAIVGGMSGKGNTKLKWIGTLTYLDKNSKEQELIFIEWGFTGIYVGPNKHPVGSLFEMRLNEIVSEYQEDIKEL